MDWMVNRGRLAAVVVGGLWLVAAVAAVAVAVAAAAPACTARKVELLPTIIVGAPCFLGASLELSFQSRAMNLDFGQMGVRV